MFFRRGGRGDKPPSEPNRPSERPFLNLSINELEAKVAALETSERELRTIQAEVRTRSTARANALGEKIDARITALVVAEWHLVKESKGFTLPAKTNPAKAPKSPPDRTRMQEPSGATPPRPPMNSQTSPMQKRGSPSPSLPLRSTAKTTKPSRGEHSTRDVWGSISKSSVGTSLSGASGDKYENPTEQLAGLSASQSHASMVPPNESRKREALMSIDLEPAERVRLLKLFQSLRDRLVDLTRKNRMLNYPMSGRSKRFLQLVDEVPEEVYASLVETNEKPFTLAALPEPDDAPRDENTEAFQWELENCRRTEVEYLTALEVLINEGRDDDVSLARLERDLIVRLRERLGMPPRPSIKEISRADYSRALGIDPSPELPAKRGKASHGDDRLQTMRFPKELEAVGKTIIKANNLAESEIGVSTLFLAFGFLEWYEDDTSDKKAYAPLLLLPVRLVESRDRYGKANFTIEAREGGAEANLSLQRLLKARFNRDLANFDEDGQSGAIETYFETARVAVSGLKRFVVRRWLVLGQFAFGRFAMYADLDPARWNGAPEAHPLVAGVLSGAERQGTDYVGGSVFGSSPEDYVVDAPEHVATAPFLIYDADSSQHSALIDALQGTNLVVHGPPGTGKSQTITNIIANFLAKRKRILFLSEKRAALDVVKSKLEKAGLGEFCLELHSDKSAPNDVIMSLKRASEAIAGAVPRDDGTAQRHAAEIEAYLDRLHVETNEHKTPFDLIWGSLDVYRIAPEAAEELRELALPNPIIDGNVPSSSLVDDIETYTKALTDFLVETPSSSARAWLDLGRGGARAPHDIAARLERYASARESHDTALREAAAVGLEGKMHRAELDAADLILPDEVPSEQELREAAAIDSASFEKALQIAQQLASIVQDPTTADVSDAAIARGEEIQNSLVSLKDTFVGAGAADLADPSMALAKVVEGAEALSRKLRGVASDVDRLKPLIEAAGLGQNAMLPELIAFAGWRRALLEHAVGVELIITLLGEERERFEAQLRELKHLIATRDRWASFFTLNDRQSWPSSGEVKSAGAYLSRGVLAQVIGSLGAEAKATAAICARLGVPAKTTSGRDLVMLGEFLARNEVFERQSTLSASLGVLWRGLDTSIDRVETAIASIDAVLKASGDGGVLDHSIDHFRRHPKSMIEMLLREDVIQAAEWLDRLQRVHPDLQTNRSLDDTVRTASRISARVDAWLTEAAVAPLAISGLSANALAREKATRSRRASFEAAIAALPSGALAKELVGSPTRLDTVRRAVAYLREARCSGLPKAIVDRLVDPNTASRERAALAMLARNLRDRDADLVATQTEIEDFVDVELLEEAADGGPIVAARMLASTSATASSALALLTRRADLDAMGLRDFLVVVEKHAVSKDLWSRAFMAALSAARVRALDRAGHFRASDGKTLDGNWLSARRDRYKEEDKKRILRDRAAVRAACVRPSVPNGSNIGPKSSWTEGALLKNEFGKQKRFTPVRQLLARASNAVQALTPCFMMSPLSLAKFAPSAVLSFDVVVIDEASQMRPEDALGALLRTEQIIVVGDDQQLPPSNFFDRSSGDGDELVMEDEKDESILGACQRSFNRVRQLKWHYRSRCESLIHFSNQNFYGGTLRTFPAASPGAFSIDLEYVGGLFEKGHNRAEASRLAEAAAGFMFGHADDESPPTLGVVALNREQADLIDEEIELKTAGDKTIARYREKVAKNGEPLLVRNLENVQGDERDVILISMTYGPNKLGGVVPQSFGPINREAGHRRLNVLFSRARRRMALFSSMRSTDVRPSETSARGPNVLRDFLAYAERGAAPVGSETGLGPDSPFETAVADRLRAAGYQVDFQVGVSKFRIDLAVRHPDDLSVYLAGIECDGAAYHSSKNARDRDRLRELVLNEMGWTLIRVWSTDWFAEPSLQTQRLVKRIEDLRKSRPPRTNSSTAGLELPEATLRSPVSTPSALDDIKTADAEAPSALVQIEPILANVPLQPPSGRPNNTVEALLLFRETEIRPQVPGYEPSRSILRDAMIECFIAQKVTEEREWFTRVPMFMRQGTNPKELQFMPEICAILLEFGS